VSNGANIRDIDALSGLKAAFGRFGEDVSQILPALQKEFEEIQEWLGERHRYWEQQVDQARDQLHEARHEMHRCHRRADQSDEYVDCGFEEDQVADADRHLAECEANLETVKKWRHQIESQISDFQNDMHRLSHLASTRTGPAQAFLASKIGVLDQYIDGNITASSDGLHVQNQVDSINLDIGLGSATAKTREAIRYAHFRSFELLKGGINQVIILKNGVTVLFKPAAGEHPYDPLPRGIPRGTQYLREKAASIVDELLGLNLVPPTEIITYEGLVGSAQLYKDKFVTARRLIKRGIMTLPSYNKLTERQRQDWQLLDELIGNMDRHIGNWMLGNRLGGDFDLALIDNGLCFSETGEMRLKAKPASQQKLDSINRIRVERLLATENEWRSNLSDLVGIAAVEHMIRRAHRLLTWDYYE
jgi:hypothetical protein